MSAPKFQSFPPSFASFPDLPQPGPTLKADSASPGNPTYKSKDRDKKHKSSSSKDKKRKRERDPDHFSLESDEKLKAEEDAKRQVDLDTPRLFYSDRKGDPLNVRYGGLHSGDVPKYRIVDHGRKILGLPPSFTALHRSGKGIEVGFGGRRKVPGLTDAKSLALLTSAPTRSLVNSKSSYKYEEIDGFIRVPSRRGREQSYRSITRMDQNANSDSEASSASDPAGDGDSSEDEDAPTTLTSHQATLKSLQEKLTADPSSIANWLLLLSQTLSTIPITSKNATTARADITLSILSRALAADVRNGSSKSLRIKYIKAGEEVWHESKVRAEWEDALKIRESDIWLEWLEWRARKGGKGINGFVEDAKRASDALKADEIGQVRVMWRVAIAFQQAGFKERATALFQAQAELTFEVPQALYGLPMRNQLDALEEFWESEVPRAGESDAKGWAQWVSSGRPLQVSSSSAKPSLNLSEDKDPYRNWAFGESQADRMFVLPARSTDLDDSDSDPYATILFSDIRDFLVNLSNPEAKDVFRLAWLSILGLHVPGFTASSTSNSDLAPTNWDDRWILNHLTRPSYLSAIFPSEGIRNRIQYDAVSGVMVGREKEYGSGLGAPVKNWGRGVLGPLSVPVDSKGKTAGVWGKEDVQGLDETFVRGLFSQLRLGTDDWEWDILALAYEAAINVKSALKLSRSFLSVSRDSVPHWAAHAHLERMRGRIDDARKVYQTVLVSSSRPGGGQLFWDWAEMEWLVGKPNEALQVVFRAAGVHGQGGVVALRAKRNLEDALRAAEGWTLREPWIKLRALLDLLLGSSPADALEVFDKHISETSSGTVAHESLTVASLLTIFRHTVVLRNPSPPALLRDRAQKAVETYPSNSVLVGLFLESEKGHGVWGRVRGTLGESGGKDKDVARRVEEVWIAGWERGRWEAEIERTRSGLTGAIESERTRGSPVIWRIFLEFEIRAGEFQRAKKMLYRAIGDCPLCKELYLLAFGQLRSAFDSHELNGFADTMAERGLRMRRELDELLEGWVEEDKGATLDDSSSDEMEENAREMRRLMPY